MRVLVAGASGNLGSRVAEHLLAAGHAVRLLIHRTAPSKALAEHPRAEVARADLGDAATLDAAVRGVDAIVHLAGVLFRPHPERFLTRTNVGYVENLARAALGGGVKRYVLISFPHVEGESTPARPARGGFDCNVDVAHFQTRLAAEKRLLALTQSAPLRPLILRVATVYGAGVKLVEGARWLMRRRLFAVWPEPTWLHLIALPDFLRAMEQALEKPIEGVVGVGDDEPLLLQDFADSLAQHWGFARPRRLPRAWFRAAAAAVETGASLLGTGAPLTRDFIKAGFVSSVADTRRMKEELLPSLLYPTFKQGIEIV